VTLKTAGYHAIAVTDTTTADFSGSEAGIGVSPAAASTFQVSGFPAAVSVGDYGDFTVTPMTPTATWPPTTLVQSTSPARTARPCY